MNCPHCNEDAYHVSNTISEEDANGVIERTRYMVCSNCGYKDKDIWYLTRNKPQITSLSN